MDWEVWRYTVFVHNDNKHHIIPDHKKQLNSYIVTLWRSCAKIGGKMLLYMIVYFHAQKCCNRSYCFIRLQPKSVCLSRRCSKFEYTTVMIILENRDVLPLTSHIVNTIGRVGLLCVFVLWFLAFTYFKNCFTYKFLFFFSFFLKFEIQCILLFILIWSSTVLN